jgi:hypothetical protein
MNCGEQYLHCTNASNDNGQQQKQQPNGPFEFRIGRRRHQHYRYYWPFDSNFELAGDDIKATTLNSSDEPCSPCSFLLLLSSHSPQPSSTSAKGVCNLSLLNSHSWRKHQPKLVYHKEGTTPMGESLAE